MRTPALNSLMNSFWPIQSAAEREEITKTRPPFWAAPLAGDQVGRLGASRSRDMGIAPPNCKLPK